MPKLTEIAAAIEKTADDITVKKAAFEKAQATTKAAEQAYLAAVASIRPLHDEYQKAMKDILSMGGTVHVAGV